MQFQEFVSKIKSKYPEYKDFENTDLGLRILTKHPQYFESVDSSTIPNPYQANETLKKGLGYNADERQRKLMDAALNPLDQENYKAKLYYDQKFGIDHTPTLLDQQVKLEYGKNATLQDANKFNERWAEYQFDQYTKFTQSFLINWERLKVAAKSLPEQFLVQLNESNIGTSPMGIPNTNFIEYQKSISQNVEAVENMPSMQLLRKSAQQDAEKRDMYIQKFRNPKAQSLAKSWNEGNFKQLGDDLFDLALLELPNFYNIVMSSIVNPALGLAYVGATSSGSRYQEGIANGESPKEAAGKANLHAIAEVAFEKLGTVGLIESTLRRAAKKEFTRSFVQKSVDLAREPATEVATQISQNLVDGKDWNEGVVEAAAIGAIYGAGVNTAITLGDATRTRFQNTNRQIDQIVESDPILSETPERAELARTAFKQPSNENLTALNNNIFKEEEVIAEPTPVVEETQQQETVQEFFERTKPAKPYKDFGEKRFVIGQEGKPLILKLSDLDETIPMNELRYDVTELAEFIEKNGLPDDVRLLIEVTDKGAIVREGNHRIAALRMLKEQGKINDYNIPFELQYKFPLQESTDVWMPKSLQPTPVVEPTPVAEPTKTIEQVREEAGVVEDDFADVKDALLEETTPQAEVVNKTRSRLLNDITSPLLSLVEDVAPSVGTRLRKFEFDVKQRKTKDVKLIQSFLDEMLKLAQTNPYQFTQVSDLLQNGKYKKAEEFLSKNSIKSVRSILEKYADELDAVGFDVSRQTDYFPRRVKDYEGLKEELGSEISGQIDIALGEQQKKAEAKGYVLSPIEESKIINNVITGVYRPIGGVKPRALKQRKIDEITSDISPYYYDAQESILSYLSEVADIVETRKLFGKDLKLDGDVVDVNESIGAYINEIAKDLEPKDQSKLISLFRDRFGYRSTGKVASKYRSIVAMTTLGQVQNAITQIGDVTWSIYENGYASTIQAAFGEKGIKVDDLGISEIAEEYKDPDGFNKVVDVIFETTGFRKIDQLGKETLINAALIEYQNQAETGQFTRAKQDRLNILFPEQSQRKQVIKDLKSKQNTKDVKFLLFSTLLDWQPISLSNMPPAYLKMPNGRVLYTLKTFTIKQLDIFRQRGIDNIAEGIATKNLSLVSTGFGEIIRIAGLFYMMNMPIDLIKDWITGKNIDFSDTLIDNLYKLIGVSRYNIEYATRGGRKPSEVLVRTVVPPFSFMDIPSGDLISIINNLKKGEETDLLKLESWRFLPFAGQTLYYTVGKGKEKEEKKAKQKEKEK